MTRTRVRAPCAMVLTATLLLVAGCTDGGGPQGSATPSSPVTAAAETPSPSPSSVELGVEFAYQAPESPCPPVSALPTLASDRQNEYVRSDAFLIDDEPDDVVRDIFMGCQYQPAATAEHEDGGPGYLNANDLLLLQDHLVFDVQMNLYPEWDPSGWPPSVDEEPPLASDSIDDWNMGRGASGMREGCGADLRSCADGEEPRSKAREYSTHLHSHVGNLRVETGSRYIAMAWGRSIDLPAHAEQMILDLHREFLLWIVDNWEHAGQ